MRVPYISGIEWERMVFGFSAWDFPKPKFIPTWKDAIEEVAANQQRYGWNTRVLNTPTAQAIFKGVKTRLNERFRRHLELYCAIGTSLDWDYGTDGFFRIGRYVVSIDLTANREKEAVSRESDIVVVLAQDVLGAELERPCQRVAHIFNSSVNEADLENPKIVSVSNLAEQTVGVT